MPALEFSLPPEDFSRLLRLQAFGRHGVRPSPCNLVWHDSADCSLLAAGLVLCEQGTDWRLEQTHPAHDQAWPPGSPPLLLQEAASLDELAQARRLPQPLVPIAAFHGREACVQIGREPGAASVTLIEGVLRGVTQERSVARVTLRGTAASVLELSNRAAMAVRLATPRCSLAVEAIGLARGQLPPLRPTGAPSVPQSTTLDDAIAIVLGHLTDMILAVAPDTADGHSAEPVHQMRVAVRRTRSALSVFKRAVPDGTFDDLKPALKHLAYVAGQARDWDVFLAGAGAAVCTALEDDARIKAMLAAGARQRSEAYAGLREFVASDDFRLLQLRLVQAAALRAWNGDPQAEQAAGLQEQASVYATHVLDRFFDHMLAAGDRIDELPIEALHDIRKQGKRLRYACEFFAPLYGRRSTRRFIDRLSTLQDALGHLNDTAAAGALMATVGRTASRQFAAGAVMGFVAAQAGTARHDVGRSWQKLRRQEPFWT